jgi:hypothetical protein
MQKTNKDLKPSRLFLEQLAKTNPEQYKRLRDKFQNEMVKPFEKLTK